MKPQERLRAKKELYSLNQWLLAQNNWVLISISTGRQSAGYIIPLFFLVLPTWASLSHYVATILVSSRVAWIPPCPCSIPSGYWSAINPVQLIICLFSLDSNPRTPPHVSVVCLNTRSPMNLFSSADVIIGRSAPRPLQAARAALQVWVGVSSM